MPDLEFPPMSSPDSSRDNVIDMTGALEDAEILTGAITVTSSDASVITGTGTINSVILTTDRGRTIAIGKGVQLRILTHLEADGEYYIYFRWAGNSGSSERYKVKIQVVDYLTE